MPRRVPMFLDPTTEGSTLTNRSRNRRKVANRKAANSVRQDSDAKSQPTAALSAISAAESGLPIELNQPPLSLTYVASESTGFFASILEKPSLKGTSEDETVRNCTSPACEGVIEESPFVDNRGTSFMEQPNGMDGRTVTCEDTHLNPNVVVTHHQHMSGEDDVDHCWDPHSGADFHSFRTDDCDDVAAQGSGNGTSVCSEEKEDSRGELNSVQRFEEERLQADMLTDCMDGDCLQTDEQGQDEFGNEEEDRRMGIGAMDDGITVPNAGEQQVHGSFNGGLGLREMVIEVECPEDDDCLLTDGQLIRPARIKDLSRAKKGDSQAVDDKHMGDKKGCLPGEDYNDALEKPVEYKSVGIGNKKKKGGSDAVKPPSTAAHSRVPAKALSAEDRLERIRNLACELKKSQKVAGRLRVTKQALQHEYDKLKDFQTERHIFEKYKAVTKLLTGKDQPDILSLLADAILSGSLPLGSIRFHRLVSLAVNSNKESTNQIQYSGAEMRYFSSLKKQSCAAAVLEAMRGPMNVGEGHGKHLLRTARVTEFVPSLKAIERFEKQMAKEAQTVGEPPPPSLQSDIFGDTTEGTDPDSLQQSLTYIGPGDALFCVEGSGLELTQQVETPQGLNQSSELYTGLVVPLNDGPVSLIKPARKSKGSGKSKKSQQGTKSTGKESNRRKKGSLSLSTSGVQQRNAHEHHTQQSQEEEDLHEQEMHYEQHMHQQLQISGGLEDTQMPERDFSDLQRDEFSGTHMVPVVMQEEERGQHQARSHEYESPSQWQDPRMQLGLGMGGNMMGDKERSFIICQPMPQMDLSRDYISHGDQEQLPLYRHQNGMISHRSGDQSIVPQFEQSHIGGEGSAGSMSSIRTHSRSFHHTLNSDLQEREASSYLQLHGSMVPLHGYDSMDQDLNAIREANMVGSFMRSQPSCQTHIPLQHPELPVIRNDVEGLDSGNLRPQLGFAPYGTSDHPSLRFLPTSRQLPGI